MIQILLALSLALVAQLSAAFASPTVTLEYDLVKKKQVDLLFVIDNSGSMQSHQERLALFGADLLGALEGVGYQFTVITTDPEDRFIAPIVSSTSQTPSTQLATMIRKVGTNGNATEEHLQTTKNFLESESRGLLERKDTHLEIIYLTDESDQSRVEVQELIGVIANPTTKASLIAPMQNTFNCSRSNFENTKLEDLVAVTGGDQLDICASAINLKSSFVELGKKIAARSSEQGLRLPFHVYTFTQKIDPESIRVSIGSTLIKRGLLNTGWVFDEVTNSLHLGKNVNLPRQNSRAKLRIRYKLVSSGNYNS